MPDTRIAAYEIEARLLRWGDSSTAGRTITLELDPDAGDTHPFKGYGVGKTSGQRFKMLFMPILDDETVVSEPAASEPPRGARVEQDIASGTNDTKSPSRSEAGKLTYAMKDKMAKAATRAVMLCRDERFREWAYLNHSPITASSGDVAEWMRQHLSVDSRSEISSNEDAYNAFLALELSYQQAVGLAASPR